MPSSDDVAAFKDVDISALETSAGGAAAPAPAAAAPAAAAPSAPAPAAAPGKEYPSHIAGIVIRLF